LLNLLFSSRVLVLDKGEVKEFESPQRLLGDQSSLFYAMAHDANLIA
jgi:ABC-type multidrug transport system fused ATPase/permease subunit